MDGHESSTETGFFSSCLRLAFPCVWATVIHGTGVLVPPHARLPPWEVMNERTPQEKNGKVVTQQPASKASLGWEKWEVAAWIMDIYWSVH